MFKRAWNAAPDGANTLREELQKREDEVAGWMDAGGTFRSASNGHSAEAFQPGANSATMAEQLEAWCRLGKKYDDTKLFLTLCNKFGLDPLVAEECPSLLTSSTAVSNPIPVTDNDVGEWMMGTAWALGAGVGDGRRAWGGTLTAIHEAQSDFGSMRTVGGTAYI